MEKRLLTIDEVAWYLRLSHMTIYRMIQRGELRAIKVANQWRFPREAVEKWLADSMPSKKLRPPSFLRKEKADWEKRYRPAFHQFVRDIIETKPDILALVDRRGARLFSEWEEVPSDYQGIVSYYHALECMPKVDISGKYIALLDDSVQHGTTLHRKREDLEEKGALVSTFAFTGCETFLSGKKELEDPEVRVCLRLADSQFTRTCAEVTEYLLGQGKTQDIDHFALLLVIRGKKEPVTLEQFLEFLSGLGDVFIVPSPAEENNIVTVTLDRPNFFRFEVNGLPAKIDFEDGVIKVRFYFNIETNTCLCLPIVMPKVIINTNTYFDIETRDTKLPINLKELGLPYDRLSEREKATSCYRDISMNISLALAEQTIKHLNSKDSPFRISLGEPSINREDLQRCYGEDLGSRLSGCLIQHLSKSTKVQVGKPYQEKLLEERDESILPLLSTKHMAKRQLQAMFDIMPVIKLLTRWYDELKATISDREERLTKNGLTFSNICQQLETHMERSRVSFALDLGLDRTVIAPVHLIEQMEDGEWEIRRGYRPGESAPGDPPKVGHGDSKALDPAWFRFRRDKFLLPFVLNQLMKYCPSQRNGVEPFLLFKVLACLRLDWLMRETRKEPTFWGAPPAEFGPLPQIPRSSGFVEDGGNPYQLAQARGSFCEFKPTQVRSKTGKARSKNCFVPVEGWSEVVPQYYDGDELSNIDAYLRFYSVLYNRVDSHQREKPAVDILLTLSACYSEEATYKYAHKNLLLWVARFGHFIDLYREKFVCGRTGNMAKAINGSEATALSATDKISRYETLQDTERTLRQTIASQDDLVLLKLGEDILGRIEKADSLSIQLLTLKQMGELMKALSTLAKYMFSRVQLFDIPDNRPINERAHKLDYYLAQARKKAEGIIIAKEFFTRFELADDSIGFDTLRSLMEPIDMLYQEVCLSFYNNCPEPERVGGVDAIELANRVISVERWFHQHAVNDGILVYINLDKLSSDFSRLSSPEIERITQWRANRVDDIVKDLGGEAKWQEENAKLAVFEDSRNALAAAITILHEASELVQDSTCVPIGISICRVARLKHGLATENELKSKINWARRLADITPAGLYVTEDILGAANQLGIECNVHVVPKAFDTLGQKVYKVCWNLVEPELLSNSGKPLLHINVLRKLEELAPMDTLRLLHIYSKEEQDAGSNLDRFHVLLIPHFLPDLFGLLLAIAKIGAWPGNVCLIHKPYPYKNFEETKQALMGLGYRVFPLQQKEEALKHVISQAKHDGKQIIIVEDGGYITPLIHTKSVEEMELFRGIVEQTTKGVDRVKAQVGERKLKLPYRSVAQSRIKAEFESPAVAKAAIGNVKRMLPDKMLSGKTALVIGYGNIGKSLALGLRDEQMIVHVYDKEDFKLAAAAKDGFITDKYLPNLIEKARLILGATGNTSIGEGEIPHLQNNSVLVSVSSDQEEINPSTLAKFSLHSPNKIEGKGTEYVLIKDDNRVLVLGDGFPITFVGVEGIPNQVIDLVLTELYLNIIDLACGEMPVQKGIDADSVNALSKKRKVIERWREIHYT